MDVVDAVDYAASKIASAIGEPARARILYCLMDGRARTGTELSAVANVGTSTTSAHLDRLAKARLVGVVAEGRHRYYSLAGPEVARILEGLSAIAGATRPGFSPSTPDRLRHARTCYDHIAGSLGVKLHDRLLAMGWISVAGRRGNYAISAKGRQRLMAMGIEAGELEGRRRRTAYGCLDWSERRFHIAGALGAAILNLTLRRKWLIRDLDGRGLSQSVLGQQEFRRHFGLEP
jgi:DNA-binding transcriptional ArsR family regulator/Fe2+ transport system protein FeoA